MLALLTLICGLLSPTIASQQPSQCPHNQANLAFSDSNICSAIPDSIDKRTVIRKVIKKVVYRQASQQYEQQPQYPQQQQRYVVRKVVYQGRPQQQQSYVVKSQPQQQGSRSVKRIVYRIRNGRKEIVSVQEGPFSSAQPSYFKSTVSRPNPNPVMRQQNPNSPPLTRNVIARPVATDPGILKPLPQPSQSTPEQAPSDESILDRFNDDCITRQNAGRTAIGLAPLTLNRSLVNSAQIYAQYLADKMLGRTLPHSSGKNTPGENLYFAKGKGKFGDCYNASQGWLDERKNYYGQPIEQNLDPDRRYGHYTQIIWDTTTSIGCGQAVAIDQGVYTVCHYWPPGNYKGAQLKIF